jgi:acyl carrier protein
MDQAGVEAVILGLLAEDLGCEPQALMEELRKKGPGMPIDSLLAVDILTALEERLGVRLPEDHLTAASLRSVRGYARRVCAIAADQASERKAGA